MAQRPVTFPASGFAAAMSFFEHVKARFESDPAVYMEVLRLLGGVSSGETTDRRDVTDKVLALLRGHPDLVHHFNAFLPDEHVPEPAREDNAKAAAPTRPKRERRPMASAAASVDNDADTGQVLMFFERVKQAGLYEMLLELIFHVGSDETLDGNQIYSRAREVFGPAHVALLREFTEYLPPTGGFLRRRAKKEPPLEHRVPSPKRKAAAADKPIVAAKRPRAEDRKTTTNRRANSPVVVKSGEVSEFREAWEFETTYSKLVAMTRRTKELLKQYEPPSEDSPPPPPLGQRAFEILFPSRECQEVLREMYHGSMLQPIQQALEDGARTELALRTINRRLGMLEQVAVKMAMERRDRARVEGRMYKLAADRVLVLRKDRGKQSNGT